MSIIYNIIETANVHGGSMDYLMAMLEEFEHLKNNFGVKYQPFKYDEIALEDYEWYSVYKELYFSPVQWKEIIEHSNKSKDVWLDIFDDYSIKILNENINQIYGLKLQASVVRNYKILQSLSKIDLSDKKIILNISSFTIAEIKELLSKVKDELSTKEIVLQVGFQDYPTEIQDSGLSKIGKLKEVFNYPISFGDHISPDSEDALYLPIIASLLGASIIEKHIKHSDYDTKYDYHSSLSIEKYTKYLDLLELYNKSLNMDFINNREKDYLLKSLQKPILRTSFKSGTLLNIDTDFDFKRTNQEGMATDEIEEKTKKLYLLKNSKNAKETIKKDDLISPNIATIIACRMKSTRLPKKATLKIGDVSSIELCIKNALKFQNIDYTILATSDLEEDAILKEYTYSDDVIFHMGDPEDVIKRYLSVINKMKIETIIRVTGDMPYISDDILQILLRSHFETGADYTAPRKAAVGTNPEIINAEALRKVKSYFPSANYSEYMTYYFTNNPSHFKLNFVDLPDNYIRDYRLTLDYEEDLTLFNEIENYLKKNEIDYKIAELFKFLDNNPDIAKINMHRTLRYRVDEELIATLKRETTINENKL